MLGFSKKRRSSGGPCIVCGKREGTTPIRDGYVCGYCVPVRCSFDMPSADEVRGMHIGDPEILHRIDIFSETESYADIRFDDVNGLMFKGSWPNYCIPVLEYSEITGYRMMVDDRPIAFNSIGGQRSLFTVMTDENLKKASREVDRIVLELDTCRSNVSFRPYQIRGPENRASDTREGCLRIAVSLSRKLDSIVENNILNGVKL